MSRIKGLFLDDERVPQDVTWIKYPENVEWVVVRSYDEFFMSFIGETSKCSRSITISRTSIIMEWS